MMTDIAVGTGLDMLRVCPKTGVCLPPELLALQSLSQMIEIRACVVLPSGCAAAAVGDASVEEIVYA